MKPLTMGLIIKPSFCSKSPWSTLLYTQNLMEVGNQGNMIAKIWMTSLVKFCLGWLHMGGNMEQNIDKKFVWLGAYFVASEAAKSQSSRISRLKPLEEWNCKEGNYFLDLLWFFCTLAKAISLCFSLCHSQTTFLLCHSNATLHSCLVGVMEN